MDEAGGLTINGFWVVVAAINFVLVVLVVVFAVAVVRWFMSRSQRAQEIEDLRARVERLESQQEAKRPPEG